MADEYFMKQPCKHCPFRRDVRPYFHPERGEQLAYHAQNPYNSFSCHKTTEYCEERDEQVSVFTSKECAGFMALQIAEGADCPEGFEPNYDLCYEDVWEMIDAYSEKD